MEKNRVNSIFEWLQNHLVIVVSIIVIIPIIGLGIWMSNTKNPKTIVIEPPKAYSGLGTELTDNVIYKVYGGASLSADIKDEIMSAFMGTTSKGAILSELLSLHSTLEEQGSATKTTELVIPANAWCTGEEESMVAYRWIERSCNYFSKKENEASKYVLIFESIALCVYQEGTKLELHSYNINQ